MSRKNYIKSALSSSYGVEVSDRTQGDEREDRSCIERRLPDTLASFFHLISQGSSDFFHNAVRTFSALSITPLLTAPTTLSQCCGYEKPDERIFRLAVSRSAIDEDIAEHGGKGEVREDVIFVGDELEAYVSCLLCTVRGLTCDYRDYYGATSAGLSARLLRRPGEWSDGAKRNAEDEEAVVEMGVNVVRSLDSLVQEIRSRNGGVEV